MYLAREREREAAKLRRPKTQEPQRNEGGVFRETDTGKS